MYRINTIALSNYRNLETIKFEAGEHFNIISGKNGAGKSNLLEALYFISSLRSFRKAKVDAIVSNQAHVATIHATIAAEDLPETINISLGKASALKVQRNHKRPRSQAQYRTFFPAVVFHPSDVDLATGNPEPRRNFLDRILEQMDPSYGEALASYRKALRNRNKLLQYEELNKNSIRAYDEILANAGSIIGRTRETLMTELSEQTSNAFSSISGEGIELELSYEPSVPPTPGQLFDALQSNLEKDRIIGYTRKGPHADDVLFRMQGKLARNFASQGQQRAMVLALKVAELLLLKKRLNKTPFLLLDDVSSELDRERNRRLFDLVRDLDAQTFLTTTHPEFIQLDLKRKDYAISNGTLSLL
ncbi:MAG: DNA replication/repair protein RecF [Myxococcales bacterium]|nr:MAG: DNA replication/repair protein RecF [Myxococcales bacterium]